MGKGLGRGLSALISEKNISGRISDQEINQEIKRQSIDVKSVKPGRFQPRTYFREEELAELADSIRKNGVVQPIIVRIDSESSNSYEIIAGERRWRAARMNNLAAIPAIIMDIDDKKALEIGLVENVQRQNLTPMEEAEGYQRLISEFSYTQEELAEVIGKSRSQIANTLRMLALPDFVRDMVNEGDISAGHARAILASDNQEDVAKRVVKSGLNVRQTEKLVKKLAKYPREQKKKITPEKDPEIIRLEEDISRKIGLSVAITNKDEGGKVIITYHSLTELDTVLRKLEN